MLSTAVQRDLYIIVPEDFSWRRRGYQQWISIHSEYVSQDKLRGQGLRMGLFFLSWPEGILLHVFLV